MIDVECWMVDSFRIQNCSFKISHPVRSVRFQEIMGFFNFGFWVMDFGFIQNSEFKVYHSLLPLGIFGGGFDNGGEDFLNA